MNKGISRRGFLGRGLASMGLVGLLGSGFSTEGAKATPINTKWKIEKIGWPMNIEPLSEDSYPITEAHSLNELGEVVGLYGFVYRIPYYMGYFIHRNGVTRQIELDEDLDSYGPGIGENPARPRINNFGDILMGKVIYLRNNDKLILSRAGKGLNDHCDVVAYDRHEAILFINGDIENEVGLGFWSHGDYLAINNNKQIIGSDGYNGYFWENGKIFYPVKLHPNYGTNLRSINNHGVFIGKNGYWGYIWRNKGQEVEFIKGGNSVNSINDNELIVGAVGHHVDAFISNVKQRVSLYDFIPKEVRYIESEKGFQPGWTSLNEATCISNKGQIVGDGYFVNKEGVKRRHGFLMTPIPLLGDLDKNLKVDFKDVAGQAGNYLKNQGYSSSREPGR